MDETNVKRVMTEFELEGGEKITFINESGLEFKDISSEKYMVYVLSNGDEILIENPLLLNVSKSGGHRLFDAEGVSWYVQPAEGWAIFWEVNKGEPNFSL